MLVCHDCAQPLVRTRELGDPQWVCLKCRARVVALSTIARLTRPELAQALKAGAEQRAPATGVPCASCRSPMREVELDIDSLVLPVDVCRRCQLVRFDAGELDQLPLKERYASLSADEARRTIAADQVRLERLQNESRDVEFGELTGVDKVFVLLGLPVIPGPTKPLHGPWLTWTLAIFLVVVAALAATDDQLVLALAWIPAEPFRLGGLTLLTSFFVHAGWLHLIGNLYFLVAFGKDFENRLGMARMALVLGAGHFLGSLLHAWIDPRKEMPLVGASAGLSAMLLAYAVLFPWERIVFLFRPFGLLAIWGKILTMPACMYIGAWVLWQCVVALLQHYGEGTVSGAGHLGGALAGLSAALLWRRDAGLRAAT